MNERDRQLAYRIRMLPDQLDRARRRVIQLEREAERLGMFDLLPPDRRPVHTLEVGKEAARCLKES